MQNKILNAINTWITSNQNITDKIWQVSALQYLSVKAIGYENAVTIDTLMDAIKYNSTKSEFQQLVLVPLKNQKEFYIGSYNKGVFVVASVEDAKKSVEFYETRIKAESHHLDNLKKVMKLYGCQV